jgi:hypothetical protein
VSVLRDTLNRISNPAPRPAGDDWRVSAIPGVSDNLALELVAGLTTVEACEAATARERALNVRSSIIAALAARRRAIYAAARNGGRP